MLKTALAKAAHGFLVGVGFAIALGLLIFGFDAWQTRKFREHAQATGGDLESPNFGFKQFGPAAGLTIKEHRPQQAQANSAFLGSIQNAGKDSWQSVGLLVELFDKEGTFVDKCSGHLDGSIGPGETRNFKVSCAECRASSQPLVYDRYTIKISDAYYVQPETARAH